MAIDARSWHRGLLNSASALAVGTVSVFVASPMVAQTPLPGIVVEGATLERRARPPRPTTESAPAAQASGETGPAAADGQGGGEGGVPIDQIGSAVTVITGEDLRRQQIRYVADALRGQPGVSVTRVGGFGGLTEVRLRGGEANQTLVVIDGVEVNDPTNGAYDFSDLDADDIERIEIIRGPYSGIYGAGAVGGVVNIITRGGRGPAKVTVKTEAGTFDTTTLSARVSGGNDEVWGSASASRIATTGFNVSPFGNEDDEAKLTTFNVKAGAQILPGVVLDFVVRGTNKTAGRDSESGNLGDLTTAVDAPSFLKTKTFLAGVNLKWDSLDGRLTQIARANVTSNKNEDFDLAFGPPAFVSRNEGEALRYAYQATYRFAPAFAAFRQSVTGLVEFEEQKFTSSGDFADGLMRRRDVLGTAGEWNGEWAQRLFVTAGVRHDEHSVFEDFTTWRLSSTLKVAEWGMRPHAGIGTGVKVPTMFEQFGTLPGIFNPFVPNPNLQPEESLGWDAGVEFAFWSRRAILDVTYFNMTLENKIARDPNRGPADPTLINLSGESTREGVEISTKLQVLPGLAIGLAYTYTDARDSDGRREVRRPPHAGRIDLDYTFLQGRGLFHLSAQYNGRRDDLGFRVTGPFGAVTPEIVGLDDYWLLSAAVSYKVQPGVELFGRVENLLDTKYQEIYGFNTAGAAAYAGVRMTLGGEDGVALASSSGR
jgi:vitamin B12 transporter